MKYPPADRPRGYSMWRSSWANIERYSQQQKVEQLKALTADKRMSVADNFCIAMLNYSQQ